MADAFKACAVDGCKDNAHWRAKGARGWCLKHYKRWRKHGDPLLGGRSDNSGRCSVDGCDRKAKSMGLCNAHYLRSRTRHDPSSGKAMRGAPARFFREVVLAYDGDECLIWPFARNKSGYAKMFAKDGGTTIVSRRVCEAVNGPPPSAEHQAAHSCGKGHLGCVAPQHMSWKLPVDNAGDMVRHGTNLDKARGEGHPNAILTEKDVREIRRLRGKMPVRELAQRYGVRPETIKAIYAGRTWRSQT